LRLQNKIALITGAGTGIGRACALAFAREGARVALVGRRKARLDHVTKECGNGALPIAADVSNREEIERIIEKTVSHFGRVDVLVNNAGILVQGTAETLSEEDWDRMFNTNVRGVWLLSRAALASMRKAGGGSIINISSVLGLVGARKRAGYAATKGAVTLLTKCMAIDHAADKIRVNCICPAFVETELTEAVMSEAKDPEKARQERVAMHPIGRLGMPEDIAGMAVYLASDESSWVTGAALTVDGGFTAV
jgi:meso-butanediol dehydrogenase / (S,S)-butanediol dehydrogenase / diacetyl reductase